MVLYEGTLPFLCTSDTPGGAHKSLSENLILIIMQGLYLLTQM